VHACELAVLRGVHSPVELQLEPAPGELELGDARFVAYYNYGRLHEALGNVAPEGMFNGSTFNLHSIVLRATK
jgi:hypothetical protein